MIPPCPGSRVPMSLMPRSRLTSDSPRPPAAGGPQPPAGPGQRGAHVREAEVTLDQRLPEVAGGRGARERGAEEDPTPPRAAESEGDDRGGGGGAADE